MGAPIVETKEQRSERVHRETLENLRVARAKIRAIMGGKPKPEGFGTRPPDYYPTKP